MSAVAQQAPGAAPAMGGAPPARGRASSPGPRFVGPLLVAPLVLFLIVFCLVPLGSLLAQSGHPTDAYGNVAGGWSLDQYEAVFASAQLVSSLWKTVLVSVLVVILCMLLGFPAAAALAGARSNTTRAILYTIVVSPLLTSVIVRTYAWVVTLSADGPVNKLLTAGGIVDEPVRILFTLPASVIAITHVLVPFAILPLAAALSTMNPDLRKAAAVLGANRRQIFFHLTLPTAIPGLVSGALLVFATAMGTYVTPLLVGGVNQPLTAIQVYVRSLKMFNIPLSAALSFCLLLLTVLGAGLLIAWFRRWEKRNVG